MAPELQRPQTVFLGVRVVYRYRYRRHRYLYRTWAGLGRAAPTAGSWHNNDWARLG